MIMRLYCEYVQVNVVLKTLHIQFFFFNSLDMSRFMVIRPIMEVKTVDHYSVNVTYFQYHLMPETTVCDRHCCISKDILQIRELKCRLKPVSSGYFTIIFCLLSKFYVTLLRTDCGFLLPLLPSQDPQYFSPTNSPQ